MNRKIFIALFIALSLSISAQGAKVQEETGFGIGLSNQTIDGENYSSIALMPELNLGFVGIGLNVDLRFKLDIKDEQAQFTILESDWYIEDGSFTDYLSLYLPKIAYLRLGHKNEDFYLKAGQFWGATLGNGTILNNYSNMQFMPETRIFGLALDIDGNMFNFPYIGFESFVSNLAVFDVIGGRFYVRPLKGLEIPVIGNMEIGASAVTDTQPDFFRDDLFLEENTEILVKDIDKTPFIWSADLTLPVVNSGVFGMNVYGDFVFQGSLDKDNAYEETSSAMIFGIGGKILSLVDYDIQYINQQKDYINQYFNASYDLNRTGNNYDVITKAGNTEVIPAKNDLNATLGFEIPMLLYFDASLNGLLTLIDKPAQSAEEAPHLYPTLKANARLDNDILKIVSANFYYLKNGLDSFESITSAKDAIIGGQVDYYTGNTVISFIVDVKYNADWATNGEDEWITNTQLTANFRL